MGIKAQDIHDFGNHRAMPESHQSVESKDFISGLSVVLRITLTNDLGRGSIHSLREVC